MWLIWRVTGLLLYEYAVVLTEERPLQRKWIMEAWGRDFPAPLTIKYDAQDQNSVKDMPLGR
jgi:hypothetical protein